MVGIAQGHGWASGVWAPGHDVVGVDQVLGADSLPAVAEVPHHAPKTADRAILARASA